LDKNEYLELSEQIQPHLDRDINSSELLQFTHVWLKSRKPELHKELVRNFQQMEAAIYAHRQEQDAKDSF
tara:strand:- start:727 stop:936 length:210 start_codon:yes stop_codon:yes gene_type:complete